jgi:hypothetical protein
MNNNLSHNNIQQKHGQAQNVTLPPSRIASGLHLDGMATLPVCLTSTKGTTTSDILHNALVRYQLNFRSRPDIFSMLKCDLNTR